MLVILLQRGRGSGLAGAFGGGGGSSAFGAKTGDVFTWITVVVAAVFVLLNVLANYAFDESPKPPVTAPTTATTPAEVPPLPTQEEGAGEATTDGEPTTDGEAPPSGPTPGGEEDEPGS